MTCASSVPSHCAALTADCIAIELSRSCRTMSTTKPQTMSCKKALQDVKHKETTNASHADLTEIAKTKYAAAHPNADPMMYGILWNPQIGKLSETHPNAGFHIHGKKLIE
mmetsp:Transcript_56097/g.150134  ORF Transcript_56097/g.150134 Transcript_56097/m.150134 type:complete len:110 (-) Transcript_56097:150-479(-)